MFLEPKVAVGENESEELRGKKKSQKAEWSPRESQKLNGFRSVVGPSSLVHGHHFKICCFIVPLGPKLGAGETLLKTVWLLEVLLLSHSLGCSLYQTFYLYLCRDVPS